MLHIKQKYHLSLNLSHLHAPSPMQFAPVTVHEPDDELMSAIANDPVEHDNTWELSEHPDTQALEQFWSQVSDDVSHDPEWYTFTDDTES